MAGLYSRATIDHIPANVLLHGSRVELANLLVIVWIPEGDGSPLPAGHTGTGGQVVGGGDVAEGAGAHSRGRGGGRDKK